MKSERLIEQFGGVVVDGKMMAKNKVVIVFIRLPMLNLPMMMVLWMHIMERKFTMCLHTNVEN
jgi:hypothetical protein